MVRVHRTEQGNADACADQRPERHQLSRDLTSTRPTPRPAAMQVVRQRRAREIAHRRRTDLTRDESPSAPQGDDDQRDESRDDRDRRKTDVRAATPDRGSRPHPIHPCVPHQRRERYRGPDPPRTRDRCRRFFIARVSHNHPRAPSAADHSPGPRAPSPQRQRHHLVRRRTKTRPLHWASPIQSARRNPLPRCRGTTHRNSRCSRS